MSAFACHRFATSEAQAARAHLDAILPDAWRDGPLPSPAELAAALDDPRIILIGATAAGKPAGYVSGSVMPGLIRAGDVAMLDDLLVAPAFRGRGLGAMLVRGFRAAALELGRAPVTMWGGTAAANLPCRRAFEAAGGIVEMADSPYLEYIWPAESTP